jgi:putative nucleotidyltransferase with HDIG domain
VALADRSAWVVGGAVRDRALGRHGVEDLDVVIDGDPAEAAREVARVARQGGDPAACFALSEAFGAWRVVAHDGSWQVDLEPLRGDSLEADLALRDFTVDAIAEPVAGGSPIDPLGGLQDLALGRLRMAGPRAFLDDPLRILRLVRISVELGLEADSETRLRASEALSGLGEVSSERVFIELCRILNADRAVEGLALMSEVGAGAIVLPEIEALRGVGQSRFHHLDVHGHTMEVLTEVIALQADPEEIFGAERREELSALLAEPLADGLSRGGALRWGALLHDVAKPPTRAVRPLDRRVTFIGHDRMGADLARGILGRLRASERLRSHVAALVRNHLRLGFLVHEPQPLARRTVFAYLRACEPVQVDVTLLSSADRRATRGDRAQEAISRHLTLASEMLEDGLRWRAHGPPQPLLRGDELAGELSLQPGPQIGELLEQLAQAQYAGEVQTREQALAFARASAE